MCFICIIMLSVLVFLLVVAFTYMLLVREFVLAVCYFVLCLLVSLFVILFCVSGFCLCVWCCVCFVCLCWEQDLCFGILIALVFCCFADYAYLYFDLLFVLLIIVVWSWLVCFTFGFTVVCFGLLSILDWLLVWWFRLACYAGRFACCFAFCVFVLCGSQIDVGFIICYYVKFRLLACGLMLIFVCLACCLVFVALFVCACLCC